MEPADALPLHHDEGDRFSGDGAREHAGGMERRGFGARNRRPFPSRIHGRAMAPIEREPCCCSGEAGSRHFHATVTPITDIADADVVERVAKALANATTGFRSITVVSAGFEVRKIAVGTALLSVMRARNQALASVPKMPAAGEDVAIQALLGYLHERPIVTSTGPPTGAAPAAETTDAGPTMMLSPEALEALRLA